MTLTSRLPSRATRRGLVLVLAGVLGLVGCDDAPVAPTEPTSPPPAVLDTPVATAVVAPTPRLADVVPEPVVEAPAPRPTPTAPELDRDGGLSIRRFALTRRIEGREPVDASTRFESRAERLYAFVEARNEDTEARELVVSFFGPDRRHTGVVTLEIPAETARWRTWAYSSHVSEPGAWTAEVRTTEGALVARQRFEIE